MKCCRTLTRNLGGQFTIFIKTPKTPQYPYNVYPGVYPVNHYNASIYIIQVNSLVGLSYRVPEYRLCEVVLTKSLRCIDLHIVIAW